MIIKEFLISFILYNGNLIDVDLINQSCADYWDKNVVTHERIIKFRNQSSTYHTYKDIKVVGYICRNKEEVLK